MLFHPRWDAGTIFTPAAANIQHLQPGATDLPHLDAGDDGGEFKHSPGARVLQELLASIQGKRPGTRREGGGQWLIPPRSSHTWQSKRGALTLAEIPSTTLLKQGTASLQLSLDTSKVQEVGKPQERILRAECQTVSNPSFLRSLSFSVADWKE